MEQARVLLVDDNEATLTLLTALLHKEFAVEIARDGSEAIEKLKVHQYGAVLLDLKMPHVDGFGVLDFIRDRKPETLRRVIVLTALLGKPEMGRVGAYEVCTIIPKPFEIEDLLDIVRACVDPNAGPQLGNFISSGMLFLIADFIRGRLM